MGDGDESRSRRRVRCKTRARSRQAAARVEEKNMTSLLSPDRGAANPIRGRNHRRRVAVGWQTATTTPRPRTLAITTFPTSSLDAT